MREQRIYDLKIYDLRLEKYPFTIYRFTIEKLSIYNLQIYDLQLGKPIHLHIYFDFFKRLGSRFDPGDDVDTTRSHSK